jgi:hypothetical protein
MSTLATVRNEVKANLGIVGASQDSAIDGYIRTVLRQQRQKRYWFLRRRTTLTLSQGGYSVALPAGFSVPDFANLIYSNRKYGQHTGFNLVDYNEMTDSITTGTRESRRPTLWAIAFDSTLETNTLAPDAATIEMVYFAQDITLPTADGDTSIWFDDGFDFIRAATQTLYATFNEGDRETPASEMQAFLQRLDDKHNFYLGTGQL